MRKGQLNLLLLTGLCFSAFFLKTNATELDKNCVINILNRTIQVSEDGGWALPNVPSNMGQIRARATCKLEDGRTVSGQSDYFNVVRNGITKVGDIKFEKLDPIPVSLRFSTTDTLLLDNPKQTFPLTVTGFFADGSVDDLTAGDKGTNYSSTNETIASVSTDGVVTARANGVALISARKDGVLASRRVEVRIGGDMDSDGIPDDAERALGLNPNDPIDALEDHDNDGLSALEEYQAGTNIFEADTDGDGLTDLEELTGGTNGFVTNPLLADSDGDGISDGLEIAGGSDPNDSESGNLTDYLDFITVSPENLLLTYNAIDGEASGKLSVTGYMLDGTSVDLTQQSSGTRYTTDDITIANFGLSDGEIFAGQSGETTITVTNRDESFVVNVTVTQFDPVVQSTVSIPGYANNVDIQGNLAYIAAGDSGLQVISVVDTLNPEIIGSVDTQGISIDVKAVGSYAYLADGSEGVQIVDISEPENAKIVSKLDTAGTAQDLSVKGDFVFVADGSAGIEIFNVANPNKPFAIGSTEHLTDVKGIAVENNFMVAVGGTTLSLFDIEDPSAPLHLSSVNIGTVKDVEISNEYVYVAAYSTGYRIYKITDAGMLELKGGDRTFVPRDVAVTNGFTFFAEQLFPNVVAYVNTKNPDEPFFQDTINLSPLGDYAGTGIALNATHAFITEERYVVGSDYKATGDTKLFIAQYRELNDANGIPPTVSLVEPATDGVTVEGARLTLTADAQDDIAVGKVDFYVNNLLVAQDTTYPYSVPFTVPQNVGNIAVKAVATDLGSNSTTTVTVTLEVQNDEDGDGLGDEEEANTWMTDANNPDTDGDGLIDGEEVARGINPNNQDSDGDGRKDGDEVAAGTDPANPDIIAPTTVATEPTTDETEVAENSAIIVTFSEALSRKSVNANSIRVYGDGGVPVPGNVKLIGGDTQVLFTPNALMADYTVHEVVIGIVKDTAGNPLAQEQRFTFETGNTVDTVRPTVSNINPVHNAKDVPVNIALTVVMSERIDPESVTSDSFYIEDNSTRERIEGLIDVKDDSTTITFTPNAAFLVGRQHRIYLRSGIKDLFGNSMSNRNYYFTTAFDADGVAPLISSISVNEGETSVPVNARLNVRFDEAINSYSTKNIQLFKGDEIVAVDLTNSSDLRTATLKPKLNLEPETGYTLVVDGISDLSGNLLESAQSTSFTTGTQTDTQTGSLMSYSPKSGATDVALNATITADFSERIDPTSLTSESFRLYNNTEKRNEAATLSLSADGKRVTLTPDVLLEEGHHYYVYISWGSYLKDIAGNNVGSYHQYTFTAGVSEDAQAPSVIANNLSQGLTDVPVNAPVRLFLDETLAAHCVNEETVSLQNSTGTVSGSVALSSDRRTITFTPDEYLVAGEDYELLVAGVCDVAGNEVAEYRMDFTADSSGSVDTAYPRISSVTPTNNTSDVSVNTAIVVTFNEAVDALNINDAVRVQVNGQSGYVAGDYQVEGSVVTFTPSEPLPGSTQIRTSIYYVKDRVGNSACCWNYYFTTEDELDTTAPTVSSISPADGAMDIGVGTPIVLSFNESLNAATVNSNHFKLYSEGSIITPSVYRSADSKTITLRGTWPAGKSLSVIVTDDVQDLSGNAMADYVSLFSTAVVDNDNGRPSVSRLYPNSGANNVPSVGSIVMYTSEPMDESSLHDAFHVAENGVLVEGQITLSASGQAIEFTPDEAFVEGALVHVYLDSTARDDSGNAMNHYQGQFRMATTTATAGVRPTPNAYLPSNGLTNVSLNPSMRIVYNQDMDETTITDEFIVMRNNDGSAFPATISLADDLRTVEITPQSLLSADSYYYVSLSSNILDTDGDRQYWSRSYGFTTGEVAVEDLQAPRVTAMSPATGMENVALNPRYHVHFDEAINPYSFERIADMSISYSASNTEVLYHRYSPLSESTEHTETITQVEDLSGNKVVSHSETFTTGTGPDLTSPNYSTYLPYSNSTVAVNSSVIWVMNEVVDPLTVNSSTVYVRDVNNGSVHVAGSASIGQDGKTITWVPDNVLTAGRRFNARLGGVADISGNTNSSDSFYFYTSLEEDTAAPVVTGTSVHEGLTDVAVNARVRVKFSETISHLSLGGITLTHNGEQIAVNRALDSSHALVTLTPVTLLPAGETLSLNVSGVKDLADNVQVEDININFTTELGIDTQTGSLMSYSPKSGATD
ncbi:Ig-like domain-containing protein, partial [uncultured Alteromonas sp.]